MSNIPQKAADRIAAGIKKFRPILATAKDHEANEADTVKIITDMLSEIFGYDKYSEITSEKCIRGSYCDLTIKVNDTTQALIEAKAIYMDLKEGFVKQVIDYAVNEGIDWVVLTNGILWRVYKVIFAKPVDRELVVEINFLDAHSSSDLEALFLFTRESWSKSALNDYYDKKQALSRFSLAAVLLTDPLVSLLRRELKKLVSDVKVDIEQIRAVLENEVLKREVVEGEKAEEARKKVMKAIRKAEKAANQDQPDVTINEPEPQAGVVAPTVESSTQLAAG